MNFTTGPDIDPENPDWDFPDPIELNLMNNAIEGTLPSELGALTGLGKSRKVAQLLVRYLKEYVSNL